MLTFQTHNLEYSLCFLAPFPSNFGCPKCVVSVSKVLSTDQAFVVCSAINPILYNAMSDKFRKAFRRLLSCGKLRDPPHLYCYNHQQQHLDHHHHHQQQQQHSSRPLPSSSSPMNSSPSIIHKSKREDIMTTTTMTTTAATAAASKEQLLSPSWKANNNPTFPSPSTSPEAVAAAGVGGVGPVGGKTSSSSRVSVAIQAGRGKRPSAGGRGRGRHHHLLPPSSALLKTAQSVNVSSSTSTRQPQDETSF